MNNKEKFNKVEQKQLLIFFSIAFVFSWIMAVFMWYERKNNLDISNIVSMQMLYPAWGAALTMLITKQNDELLPRNLFVFYVIVTVIGIMSSILGLVLYEPFELVPSIIIIMGSLLFLILYFKEEKYKRISYGLTSPSNEKGYIFVGLFILLYLARIALAIYIEEGSISSLGNYPYKFYILLSIIVSFPMYFLPFFGEEYGWRGFLQPIMQNRFGNRMGIILLGLVWGMWHWPISIFYYSPKTGILSAFSYLFIGTGFAIFFGYVHMKTRNIWISVIIHYINNNFILLFTDAQSISNQVLTWDIVASTSISMLIFFGIFIFSRIYSDEKLPKLPIVVDSREDTTDTVSEK